MDQKITPTIDNVHQRKVNKSEITWGRGKSPSILGVMDQKINPTIDNVHQRKANTNKPDITWGKDTPSILKQKQKLT